MLGILKPSALIIEGGDPPALDELLLGDDEWQDAIFEAALDSGSTDHVCDDLDAPGYAMTPSQGSRRDQHFTIGNGARIPNCGHMILNLEACQGDTANQIASIFQVVKVTRPLRSVGMICNGGLDVLFNKDFALVLDYDGHEISLLIRKNGGLYTAQLCLKRPTPKSSLPLGRPE